VLLKLGVLMLMACLSACVPHAPSEDAGKNGPSLLANGQKVGGVQVDVDPLIIARPYRKTLDLYDVTGRIRDGVTTLLRKQDKYDESSDLMLHVDIADFSLRSDLSALVYGLAIESDRLELNVQAKRNGVSVKDYTIQSSYGQGGLMNAVGRSKRLDIAVTSASARVVKGL